MKTKSNQPPDLTILELTPTASVIKVAFITPDLPSHLQQPLAEHKAWMVPQVRKDWKTTQTYRASQFLKGMKKSTAPTWMNSIENITLLCVAIWMVMSFSSCGTKTQFLASSIVPSATGEVKVTKDSNKNYVIKVEFDNLAQPDRLDPPKNNYVLWMNTDNNMTKNIGHIKLGNNLKSKHLSASIETISALKPTKIFLTTEDDVSTQYPSNEIVMTTTNL